MVYRPAHESGNWLCEATEFVFGKLPTLIYFKKI